MIDVPAFFVLIDKEIETVMKGLAVGNPTDPTKDASTTWHARGQIHAYKKVKELLTPKE